MRQLPTLLLFIIIGILILSYSNLVNGGSCCSGSGVRFSNWFWDKADKNLAPFWSDTGLQELFLTLGYFFFFLFELFERNRSSDDISYCFFLRIYFILLSSSSLLRVFRYTVLLIIFYSLSHGPISLFQLPWSWLCSWHMLSKLN